MKDQYHSFVILTTNVNIKPNRLKGDINKTILNLLRNKYEGVCNKDGYIINDSIELINRSIGEIKTINNESLINYNITYRCNIISPSIDSIYDSYVESVNKLGIISYIKLKETDTMKDSPFIIINPKEYLDDTVFDKTKVNDKIQIKIKSFRIKYLSKQIQIVSTII